MGHAAACSGRQPVWLTGISVYRVILLSLLYVVFPNAAHAVLEKWAPMPIPIPHTPGGLYERREEREREIKEETH